jgi:hypothetical protein
MLGALIAIALVLGVFIQEFDGDVGRLPAALQPGARRVEAACTAVAQRVRAAAQPLAAWLGVGRGHAPRAAAVQKAEAVRKPAPPAPLIVIDYRDDKDLLGQLKCVSPGQRLKFRRVSPGSLSREPQTRCESGRCSLTETREQREMRVSINAELARISHCP